MEWVEASVRFPSNDSEGPEFASIGEALTAPNLSTMSARDLKVAKISPTLRRLRDDAMPKAWNDAIASWCQSLSLRGNHTSFAVPALRRTPLEARREKRRHFQVCSILSSRSRVGAVKDAWEIVGSTRKGWSRTDVQETSRSKKKWCRYARVPRSRPLPGCPSPFPSPAR